MSARTPDQNTTRSPRAGETALAAPDRAPLPREVVALGWVSLLTDAASDMIYPLIPAFLLSLSAGAAALGWLEGVSEAVAAVMKIVSGRLADRATKRKRLVALGYGISSASRPFFAVAMAPWHAVLVRAIDRVGKGLRGPPRDAIVAGATPAAQRGHAFGFHRMMDNFGGVVGPLLAFALLRLVTVDLRTVFALSIIPGVLAVLVVLFFVKDPPQAKSNTAKAASPAERPPLGPAATRYIAVLALFSLAGSGDLFLMRRLTDLGMDVALVPIAWVSLNLGKGLLNVPGGRASDRYGRRRVLAFAWVLYAATYAGFALVSTWPIAWVVLGLYAVHYGLAEGGQKALLAEFVPAASRGRAFGFQLAVEGAAIVVANLLFGWVYDRLGAHTAFAGSAMIALLAALALAWLVPAAPSQSARSA
jgi:MFS family permease